MISRLMKKGLATLLTAAMGLSMVVLTPMTKAEAASNFNIDPSNLNEWTTYDHYFGTGYSAGSPGSDWNTRFGSSANTAHHPYYYWDETYHGSSATASKMVPHGSNFFRLGYNSASSTDADRLQSLVLNVMDGSQSNTSRVDDFSQHIYATGVKSDAEITFLGYGAEYKTDWAIASDIDTKETKSIAFDIDAKNIISHTLDSFGVIINGGVGADKLLRGYLLAIDTAGNVGLVDLSQGTNANRFHASNTGSAAPGTTESGSLGMVIMGSNSSGNQIRGNEFQGSFGAKRKILGEVNFNANSRRRIRVELTYTDTELVLKTGYYAATGSQITLSSDPMLNGSQPISLNSSATSTDKNQGFGFFTCYTGRSHYCNRLSWVRFSFIQTSIGAQVYFRHNYGSVQGGLAEPVNVHHEILEVPTVDPVTGAPDIHTMRMLGEAMPAGPSTPPATGYVFVGWSKYDDVLDPWTIDDQITGTVNVYAIWSKPTIEISFDSSNDSSAWRKEEVTANVTAMYPADAVNVTANINGTAVPLTRQGSTTTWTGTYLVEHNTPSNSPLVATLNGTSAQGASFTATDSKPVTWIDEDPPVINGIKAIPGIATLADFTGISGADVATANANRNNLTSSGVAANSELFRFYRVGTNGALETPSTVTKGNMNATWFNGLTPGRYFYDVVVEDGVGYQTIKALVDNTGNPSDGDDPDDGVIIGAQKPSITLTPNPIANGDGWNNTNVTVNVAASDPVNLKLSEVTVKEDTNLVSVSLNPTFIANSGSSYTGSFIVDKEGSFAFTGDVKNEAALTDQDKKPVMIDKTAPQIDGMPANNSPISLATAITVVDPLPTGVNANSTLKTVTYTATGGGQTHTGSTWAELIGKLSTGTYDLTVDAEDKAGNTATKTATGLTYIDPNDSIRISITYAPNQTWTNGDVVATITVTSSVPVTDLTVGGQSVTSFDGTVGTYTFEMNKTNVPVVAKTAVAGFEATETANVTWIDKAKPTVTNLPDVRNASPLKDELKPTDLIGPANEVVFTDFGSADALLGNDTMSLINNGTKTLLLYKIENGKVSGTVTKEITWSSLTGQTTFVGTVDPGRYFYDIIVKDNAGNEGRASDAFGGNLINEGGGDSGTKPGDDNNGGDKGVIIGVDGLTVTVSGMQPIPYQDLTNKIDWYKDEADISVVVTGTTVLTSSTITDVIASSIPSGALAGSLVGQPYLAGTLFGQLKETASGIHNYTVTVGDGYQTATGKPVNRIGVDKVAPTLNIRKVPTDGALGTNLQISASDSDSGVADKFDVVLKLTGSSTPALSLTGVTEAVLRRDINALASGTYEVEMYVYDNVGHKSNAGKGTFTHDDGNTPPVQDGISVDYTPKTHTKYNVDAKIIVTSKEKITSILVNGVSLPVTAEADGVTYTATSVRTANGSFPIVATNAKGDRINGSGNVTWIDRVGPGFSNFPSPPDLVLTAAGVVGITITDKASPNGTPAGEVIDDPSEGKLPYIELYKVSDAGKVASRPNYTFVIEDLKADLAGPNLLWPSIDSGKYVMDVIAYDKADMPDGNEGKASDNGGLIPGSGVQPRDPIEPGDTIPDDPYIINPKKNPIEVTIIGTTPGAGPNGWINKSMAPGGSVDVDFTVKTEGNVTDLDQNGNGLPLGDRSFPVTVSGTYTVTATDDVPSTDSDSIDVKLDFTEPYVDIQNNQKVTTWDGIQIIDPPGLIEAGTAGPSGPDAKNSSYTAVDEYGNPWSGSFEEINKLPPGKYDITFITKDNAGNVNDTQTVTGIEIIPTLPELKLDIQITYDKNTWTNKDVNATIRITANRKIDAIRLTDAAGAPVTFTDPSAAAPGVNEITFIQTLDDNSPLTMVVDVQGKVNADTRTISTKWIDKVDPIVTFSSVPLGGDLSKINVVTIVDGSATTTPKVYGQSNVKNVIVQLVEKDPIAGGTNHTILSRKVVSGSSTDAVNAAIKELIKLAPAGKMVRIEALAEDNAGNIGTAPSGDANPGDNNASEWGQNLFAPITDVKYTGSSTVKAGANISITILTASGSATVPVNGFVSFATRDAVQPGVGGNITLTRSGTQTIKVPTQCVKGTTYYMSVFNATGVYVCSVPVRIG